MRVDTTQYYSFTYDGSSFRYRVQYMFLGTDLKLALVRPALVKNYRSQC